MSDDTPIWIFSLCHLVIYWTFKHLARDSCFSLKNSLPRTHLQQLHFLQH